MNFAGLVVITEIDNWVGQIFELYIKAFHEEILKIDEYLEFKTDNEAKIASYYQAILIASIMSALAISLSVLNIELNCSNMDKMRQNILKKEKMVNSSSADELKLTPVQEFL